MGVQGLWQLLSPAGKKIDPQTLRGKRLAIDVSIWVLKIIYGYLANPNADQQAFNSIHLIMIFRRLMALLQLGVKPVFVFDGKPPELKRQTLLLRQEIRDKREKNLKKLAERYLVKKMENKLTGQEIETGLNQKQVNQQKKEQEQEQKEYEEIQALIEGLNQQDKTDFDLKLEEHQHAILDTEFQQLLEQHPTILDKIQITKEEFLMSDINDKNKYLQVMFQHDKQVKQNGLQNLEKIDDYSKLQASQYVKYCINRQELYKIRETNYQNLNELQIKILEEKEKNNQAILKDHINQPGAQVIQGDIKSSRDQFFLMVGQENTNKQQQQIKPIQKFNTNKAPTQKNVKFQQMNQKLSSLLQDRHKEHMNLMNLEYNHNKEQQQQENLLQNQNLHYIEEEIEEQEIQDDLNQNDDRLIIGTHNINSDFFGDSDSDSESQQQSKQNQMQLEQDNNNIKQNSENQDDEGLNLFDLINQNNQQESQNNLYNDNQQNIEKQNLNQIQQQENDTQQEQQQQDQQLIQDQQIQQQNQSQQQEQQQQEQNEQDTNNNKQQNQENQQNIQQQQEKINTQQLQVQQNIQKQNINNESKENNQNNKMDQEIELNKNNQQNIQQENTIKEEKEEQEIEEFKKPKINQQSQNQQTNQENPIFSNIKQKTDKKLNMQDIDNIMENLNNQIFETAKKKAHKNKLENQQLQDSKEKKSQPLKNHLGQIIEPSDSDSDDSFDMDTFLDQEDELNMEKLEEEFKRYQILQGLNSESIRDKFQQIKELLKIFGVPYVEAPQEAEAQCAYLEILDLVDGTITDDSDSFLFGSKKVYRGVFQQMSNQQRGYRRKTREQNFLQFYNSEHIYKILGLDRHKLILIAMFLGSDYTLGIKGVGIVNALEIVQAFPDLSALERFKEWAKSADILLEDAEKHYNNIPLLEKNYLIKHKNWKKQWELPLDFPSKKVYNAYLTPTVDKSTEKFSWQDPNTKILYQFLVNILEFTEETSESYIKEIEQCVKENKNYQPKINEVFEKEQKFAVINSKRILEAVQGIKDRDKKREKGNIDKDNVLERTLNKNNSSSKKKISKTQKNLEEEMEKSEEQEDDFSKFAFKNNNKKRKKPFYNNK